MDGSEYGLVKEYALHKQYLFGEESGGLCDNESECDYEQQYQHQIGRREAAGISGYEQCRLVAPERDYSPYLLHKGKTGSDDDADDTSEGGDEPAFDYKYLAAHCSRRAKGAKRGHIVAFFDNEERVGGVDVERRHNENVSEKPDGTPVLECNLTEVGTNFMLMNDAAGLVGLMRPPRRGA